MEEHQHKETGTLTIKKSDLWKYSTFVLLAVVLIGFFIMNDNGATTTTGNGVETQEPTTAKA